MTDQTPTEPALDVAALEALLEMATPRPWSEGRNVIGARNESGFTRHIVSKEWCDVQGNNDAALIVATVNSLPALLAALASARAREAELRAALTKARGFVNTYPLAMPLSEKTSTLAAIDAALAQPADEGEVK